MAQEKYKPDETDFDDAIIEIALEIEYLNSIKKGEITNAAQISLKSEIEVKKAESITFNLVQMLKTIQEVQIAYVKINSPGLKPPSVVISKHIMSSKGSNQFYQPITITESPLVTSEEDRVHTITIDDLFEDDDSKNIITNSMDSSKNYQISPAPSEMRTPVMNSKESNVIITPIENVFKHTTVTEKSYPPTPKSIDIPTQISLNIGKQLKNNEREIFKNFMKMHKK
jgi:hypothetical protein